MSFYCGIDLSAMTSWICVVDDHLSVVLERKVPNELPVVLDALAPFAADLRVVGESTFNWYWLVDGLQDHGIDVTLAHCLGLAAISKAKVKTDRCDAFTLAKLHRAGVIPPAYIYPRETRPIRDLLRRRGHLVAARAHEYGRLRLVLLRHGVLSSSRALIKRADEDDLAPLLDHRVLLLNARL
jgi:transposase